MNKDEFLRAVKLSNLNVDDAKKTQEKVNEFLQYIKDIPECKKMCNNAEISELREDEIIEYKSENMGYITITVKKND